MTGFATRVQTPLPGAWWRASVLLVLAVGSPAVVVVLRASLPESSRQAFLAHLLYWTMPVVVVLAVGAAWWRWRASRQTLRAATARLWPGVVAALLLTGVVFWLVPAEMRVQFDETSLVGTSQNMHLQRAALMTTGAVPFEGAVVPLEQTVDKRPPLFPFLVSLLHDVSGYRIENAFVVNAALLAAALLLVFAAARSRLDLPAALAVPFLVLAVPLTSIVATSAGFELLAAVLFMVVLLAALDFVRRPDTVRWVAFLGSGVVFAQARYESLLALLLVLAIVLWSVRARWRPDWRARTALAACPLLVTPLVFLLLHARNPDFYPEAGGRPLLSLQHGLDHVLPFLAAWFGPSLENPLPGSVAIVAVVVWTLWLVRRRGSIADGIVVVPVLGVTALVLFWFYGDVREPTALRLFLPLAWLTALAPLLLPAMFGRRVGAWLLAAAVVVGAARLDAVHRGVAFPRLEAAKLTDAIDAALVRLGTSPCDTLWVTVAAQHLVVKGHAALSPEAFVQLGARSGGQPSKLDDLRGRGHVKTILFVETPLDVQFAPAFGDLGALLQGAPTEVAGRFDQGLPIVVHRLRQ